MPAVPEAAIDRRLRRLVELRRLAVVVDAAARDRVLRLARELRLELGETVPKTAAARALGVSVKALDRWAESGHVPQLRRPGAGRAELETDAVLDVLEEVTALRERGIRARPVATALARLREDGRLRPKLRPNQASSELRQQYLATTPVDRLRLAAELSYVQTRLAAAGRALAR